jgi:Ca2+-transporting ATPase
MIHEYPLDGKPPMMTHVFENKEGKRIIAKAVQKRYKIQPQYGGTATNSRYNYLASKGTAY